MNSTGFLGIVSKNRTRKNTQHIPCLHGEYLKNRHLESFRILNELCLAGLALLKGNVKLGGKNSLDFRIR